MVECGGLEMFAASLDKSSQVSFEHAKPANQPLSIRIVPYSVRKSVRRINFLTRRVLRSTATNPDLACMPKEAGARVSDAEGVCAKPKKQLTSRLSAPELYLHVRAQEAGG